MQISIVTFTLDAMLALHAFLTIRMSFFRGEDTRDHVLLRLLVSCSQLFGLHDLLPGLPRSGSGGRNLEFCFSSHLCHVVTNS